MAAIGIDLGTSCTRAAVWQRGKVEVITNENYERSLASCVTIKRTHNKRLVGNTALLQTDLDPTNTYTIQGVKSLIGRKFNDPMIQEDIKHSLLYVADYSGKPNIEIKLKNETTQFAPEEISSMILMEMKEAAEAYLGTAVHDAVITVPAHFGVSQRQATKNAGAIAGLNVIGIINDPTAAALAYSFGKDFKGKRNVLIFDLGGGTFDVSIITIDEGTLFEVKAIASDTHLGGKDFDNRLVDYIKNDYRCKHNMNLQCTPITHYQLYRAAEKAKCDLSSSMKTTVSLLDNHDYQTQITREKFEEINADLFHRTIETVKRVLKDAELDKNEIDDVVLVGGLTNIPKVQSLLENYFCGKKVIRSVHSEELVVCGAAIQAAILSGATSPRLRLVRLMEVTPHSIGIETHHGVMAKIIERNSKIPCERTLTFTTYSDNQSDISFQLYEGEQAFTKYNSVLGTFNLLNIKKASRGMPLYDVRFHIDINGILEVTAEESGTGFNKTIVNNKDRPSQIEIDRMIAEAKRYHDKKIKRQKQSIERRMSLEYMNKVQNLLLLNCSRLSEEIQKKGFSIYSEMLMLLANGSKCKNRLQKMKQLFTSIMTILNKNIPNEMKILGGYPLIITENVDN